MLIEKEPSSQDSIPGSFPCVYEPHPVDIKLQQSCVHHWICDPAIENTSLCICQKCYKEARFKNRVYVPQEKDGYLLMGGSVGGGTPLSGFDLTNGIPADY